MRRFEPELMTKTRPATQRPTHLIFEYQSLDPPRPTLAPHLIFEYHSLDPPCPTPPHTPNIRISQPGPTPPPTPPPL